MGIGRRQSALLDLIEPPPDVERLGPGAMVLRGFARGDAEGLLAMVAEIAASAPFRHMVTPGGFRMSVAMTSCGAAGWITDRRGYRYAPLDPMTGSTWPALPAIFRTLAARAAAAGGFPGFLPDSCLINRYEPETRLSLHRDENERDFAAPIVSVSLGLSAMFLFGGARRNDRPQRVPMQHGDVAVWGGKLRLAYHGVAPLAEGEHPLTGRTRINLTLRKAL